MTLFDRYMDAVQAGQFVRVTTVKELKVRKKHHGVTIVKQSEFVARPGIQYDNMASVGEKRESGELPSENQGLPWGEWEVYPYAIQHKGNRYLRFATAQGSKRTAPIYYLNGEVASREEVEPYCLASEFKAKSGDDVFNIKEENIAEMKVGGREILA